MHAYILPKEISYKIVPATNPDYNKLMANLSGSFLVLIHRWRTRVLVIFFDIASINLFKINSLLLATKNKIMIHKDIPLRAAGKIILWLHSGSTDKIEGSE